MKAYLETFIATIGCMPLIAIGLFVTGALIGTIAWIEAPVPPSWLVIPALLTPVFVTLWYQAYLSQHDSNDWLKQWRENWRRKVVGRKQGPAQSVDDLWLEDHVGQSPPFHPLKRFLHHTLLWGWLSTGCLLALGYIFLWIGMMAARF